VYGTWMQRPNESTGAYVDAWLQYGRYQNTVKGVGLSEEKYQSRTVAASLEAGYGFAMYSGEKTALYVQPQMQLSYTNYHANRHTETNGTVVTTDQAGGLTTRLGVRFYGHTLLNDRNWVQPFVTVNWLRGAENAMRFDGQRMSGDVPRNRYEVLAGLQTQLGKNWTGWGQAGMQYGSNNYRSGTVQLGLKYAW